MKMPMCLLLMALLFAAVQTNVLANEPKSIAPATAEQIAAFIEGKLIVHGAIFYVADANAHIDAAGELALDMAVIPLYEVAFVQGPYAADGGVAYYDININPKAECGFPALAPTTLSDTGISVLVGQQFLNLHEALPFAQLPKFTASSRPLLLNKQQLAHVAACSKDTAAKVAAMPFVAIELFAGQERLMAIEHTANLQTTYERELGDERVISHVRISAKPTMTGQFSVELESYAVMHCDYEGPHIELDAWKQSRSSAVPLKRQGTDFHVDLNTALMEMPPFPSYTATELRQAINDYWGLPGLAPAEQAQTCAPMTRGLRFIVKYQHQVVQEIIINTPGGC